MIDGLTPQRVPNRSAGSRRGKLSSRFPLGSVDIITLVTLLIGTLGDMMGPLQIIERELLEMELETEVVP